MMSRRIAIICFVCSLSARCALGGDAFRRLADAVIALNDTSPGVNQLAQELSQLLANSTNATDATGMPPSALGDAPDGAEGPLAVLVKYLALPVGGMYAGACLYAKFCCNDESYARLEEEPGVLFPQSPNSQTRSDAKVELASFSVEAQQQALQQIEALRKIRDQETVPDQVWKPCHDEMCLNQAKENFDYCEECLDKI